MAGIAFKLRHYTEDASYFGILKGYSFSAVLVAGPWLISATALGALAFIAQGDVTLFHAIIMYVFCFSLIYVGIFQFVVTRFLADKLYSGEIEFHIPTFVGTLLFTLGPQALIGVVFLSTLEASLLSRFLIYNIYLIINAIWVILLFLGILRAYEWVVFAFLLGGSVSLICGFLLERLIHQTGIFSAFLVGQVITLSMLIWLFLSEFPWKKPIDFSFFRYFRLYPSLAFLGLIYYLSIWVDKFIYRASSFGKLIVPQFLYAAPSYELLAFIAQLTIVPSLAIFFLRVETDFYERYREFFAAISHHHPFSLIESCKNALLRSVREGFLTILQFQGALSLAAIFLAPKIFQRMQLDDAQMAILQVLLLGTFFQTYLFLTVILMLYFELYRQALISCTLFFIANGALTLAFLHYTTLTAGWGFTLSAMGGFLYAACSLMNSLNHIPEIIFMRQVKAPARSHYGLLYRKKDLTPYKFKSMGERKDNVRNP